MAILHKATLMAAAIALSGCASIERSPDGHRTSGAPMASGEGHDMRGPMMGMPPLVGCHGAHGDADARLAELHTALHITPAQEGGWTAYAEAYRTHAAHMGSGMMMMQAGHEPGAMPPLQERLRRHDEMMSQHLASFQALRAAIERLYATLDAEQRGQVDALQCDRPS